MSVYQEARKTLITLRDFLRWAYSQFCQADIYSGHGYIDSWDEALALLAHTLHLPMPLEAHLLDAKLLDSEKQQFLQYIEHRACDRLPTAYITQQAIFAGLTFICDKRALIPRSPIAELIENQFHPWVNTEASMTILDM